MSSGVRAPDATERTTIKQWAREACERHREAVPQVLQQSPYGQRVLKAFKAHVMEYVIKGDKPNVTYPTVLWRVALVMIKLRSVHANLVESFELSILCRAMEEVMTKVIDEEGRAIGENSDVSARPLPVSAPVRADLSR